MRPQACVQLALQLQADDIGGQIKVNVACHFSIRQSRVPQLRQRPERKANRPARHIAAEVVRAAVHDEGDPVAARRS